MNSYYVLGGGNKINGWTTAPSSGAFLKPHDCKLGLEGNFLDPNRS